MNDWTTLALHAFNEIRNALSTEPVLHTVQSGCPFILFTAAYGHGIGVVLSQEAQQGERLVLVQYLSGHLIEAEQYHTMIEKRS